MVLIERQAPSHWYLKDGRPFHEIQKKDGGMRPVTLRDARAVQAFPSVTNVLSVLAKPGLDAWKIEQGIMAALTLPRRQDEPLDVFARRVVQDMSAQVDRAANFGTAIHAACEVYASEKVFPKDAMLAPFLEHWRQWFDENVERVEAVETVVVDEEHGYAGRVDLLAKLKGSVAGSGNVNPFWALVDFKTQKVKRGSKGEARPSFYETWPLQLAAYAKPLSEATGKQIEGIVSLVIDSAEPGPVHVKMWTPYGEPPEEYYRTFLLALKLWKFVKGYDPVAPMRPELN